MTGLIDQITRLSGLWWCTASIMLATAAGVGFGVLWLEQRGRR